MSEHTRIPVLVFFGPTGSGKTDLLEQVFAPEGAGGTAEIVSADSMQVYRGMDIGTAKPSMALQERLPHHLIDIRNPDEPFNVGEFVHEADQCCIEIAERGALPVISGGTGFYLKHFVQGLPESPPSDPKIRAELKEALHLGGIAPLRAELAACDPVSASRIHSNDVYRILRALEVFRLSRQPLSSFSESGAVSCTRPSYRFLLVGLEREREELYRRIDERCALMFRSGLYEEVKKLAAAGYTPADPGLRAIGYKELFEKTDSGTYRLSTDLAAAAVLVSRNSRRYAKRQITCFASLPDVLWISAGEDPVQRLVRILLNLGIRKPDVWQR